jgi:hypothetical protein
VANNRGIIIHKVGYKKGRRGMTIYWIYKENYPLIPKQVVNVVDLGYPGIEKDFPKQLSSTQPIIERKEIKNCHKKKMKK